MNDLISKLSSYNLFNYFVPGVIFSILVTSFTKYSIAHEDILIAIFIYYFVGMVISRIGSLVIEPALIEIGFIEYVDYSKYVAASKKDSKLEILLETSNTYRTIASLFLSLIILKVYEKIELAQPALGQWNKHIVVALLLILFAFSYKKQTAYITKRIGKDRKKKTTNKIDRK